jgi:hypothetical protein
VAVEPEGLEVLEQLLRTAQGLKASIVKDLEA